MPTLPTTPNKCAHEDSRLTCIECSKPLCSNCLVQCPVGFRCKPCVGITNNPLKSSSKMLVARTLAMCAGIGCGAGWIMPFIQIPFLSCIICYFLGLFSGRWLASRLDRRLEDKVGKVIIIGLLIGMALSPIGTLPFLLIDILKETIAGGGTDIFAGLTMIASGFFGPVCFVVGVMRPTVWGER